MARLLGVEPTIAGLESVLIPLSQTHLVSRLRIERRISKARTLRVTNYTTLKYNLPNTGSESKEFGGIGRQNTLPLPTCDYC